MQKAVCDRPIPPVWIFKGILLVWNYHFSYAKSLHLPLVKVPKNITQYHSILHSIPLWGHAFFLTIEIRENSSQNPPIPPPRVLFPLYYLCSLDMQCEKMREKISQQEMRDSRKKKPELVVASLLCHLNIINYPYQTYVSTTTLSIFHILFLFLRNAFGKCK